MRNSIKPQTKRVLIGVVVCSLLLYGAAAFVDTVWGECRGVDFIDDPTYSCNGAADVSQALGLVSIGALAVVVLGLGVPALGMDARHAVRRVRGRVSARGPHEG